MEAKGDFIVHGSFFDIHDNEVVNLSVDKAQVRVNGKEVMTEADAAEDMPEEVLENCIFSPSLFDSNDKLKQLRKVLADTLDMLCANNELYWVLASLEAAEVLNYQTSVADFLRQLKAWFPEHPRLSNEMDKLQKTLSAEQQKWKVNGEVVGLINLKAQSAHLYQLKKEKINRILTIAYEGLYKALKQLL